MKLREQILENLMRLVSIPGISDTDDEALAADCIYDIIREQEYFKQNKEQALKCNILEDYRGRCIVCGLVKGSQSKTVILTGHYDVVGVEEYGLHKKWAFSPEQLKSMLNSEEMPEEVKKDFESGEWIFGRGTADMKGGLAAGLSLLDKYGKQRLDNKADFDGNILFAAVPDEESYSSGMRAAARLLNTLKEEYGLEYECLINLEPCYRESGKQYLSIGSVGKCMPVVLVQGAKAHVTDCFAGLSAIGVLGELFTKTELSPEFAESFRNEICPPPTWLYFKDMKKEYDVSVPMRSYGCMNVLSFSMTTEDIIKRLKKIGAVSFEAYTKKMDSAYISIFSDKKLKKQITNINECIMEYKDLVDYCSDKDGFKDVYKSIYSKAEEALKSGKINYPEAAVSIMEAVLDFSGITSPLMIIGFAPPYYPPFNSDLIIGKSNAGTRIFEMADKIAADAFNFNFQKQNYFTGISDLSYCGLNEKFDMDSYRRNNPLAGSCYNIDFGEIEKLNIPSVLMGPWSKDIHQKWERVNIKSLTEEMPYITWKIIEQMFAK